MPYGGGGGVQVQFCPQNVLSTQFHHLAEQTWPAFDARVDSHSVASFGDGAFGTFVASRRHLVDVMSFWTRNTSIAIT